ncbi:MAG TPA: hypothetical protein VK879_18535 [Candidatus Sulfomarinibacteraceae bacterium]|nr:hypothetical protein [Candidatus Sulfomarinibacteraceae bacterium]
MSHERRDPANHASNTPVKSSHWRHSCYWLLAGVIGGATLAAIGLALLALFVLSPRRSAGELTGNDLRPTPTTQTPLTTLSPVPPTHTPLPTQAETTAESASTPTDTAAGPLPPSEPAGRIVFTCFNAGFDDICSMNADGSNQRRLTSAAATDFYPEWGPLGDLIIFSSRRDGAFRLYLMDAEGRGLSRVGPDAGSHFAPDISPDGARIVFANAVQGPEGRRQHIWVMDIDGGNLQQLTSGPFNDIDPVWSPDGARIAFASDRGWRPAHWIMNADGSDMTMLPDNVPQHGGRSDWSPDGRWLAFYAGPRDDRDIYLVATDGSGASRRLTFGGRNLAPSFSPDGQWITFTSYREGDDAEIFIMRPDGSDVRQLTFNERADWQPRWGP